jgi:hypothetical protein
MPTFVMCYAEEGVELLDSILTWDEMWVFHHTPESKQQLMNCHEKEIRNINLNRYSRGNCLLGPKWGSCG